MKKTILQKPILFIIIILVVGSLVGCADNVIEENTQEQIDAIPFSFVGEEGDWKAVVEYRQITEDDLKLLENMTEDKTREELLQDFRSVVRITYTGDQLFRKVSYSFARNTQWYANGSSKDQSLFEQLLSGIDVGGTYYSRDGKISNALPPLDGDFFMDIKSTTIMGKKETVKLRMICDAKK
ncbi:MAG: hypothetical protein ACOX05_00365 [Bacillota bacterium]|jgi:hypothetical protein